ncbi:MAG: glycosyltransferase [Actinomycetota bacterium]|nr:glycosyltransferase [Actinomycetota bacterium]
MTRPTLSIVTPAYNVAGFIPKMIDSILDQSETNWELIVVDDGSSSPTASVARAHADGDQRIRVIENPENLGPGPSRNIGIAAAGGQYLMFVDADDWLLEAALADIVSAIEESGSDLVWFDYARVYPAGTTRRNERSDVLHAAARITTIERDPELLWVNNLVTNKAYRRGFWDEIGASFPEGFYEDIPISYLTILSAASVHILDRVCYAYRRRHSGATTATASSQHLDLIDSFVTVFDLVDRHPAAERIRPIVETKFVKWVSLMQTNYRHRLRDSDYADFMTRARVLHRSAFPDSNTPLAWRVPPDTSGAFETAKSWLGTTLLRQRSVDTPEGLVFLSSAGRDADTNAAVLLKRFASAGWLTVPPEEVTTLVDSDIKMLSRAAVVVADTSLPEGVRLQKDAFLLDVGTKQSFSLQGVLAFDKPAGRVKPLVEQLRSSDRWNATLLQGSAHRDTLVASFPGAYETLMTGHPRNDPLSNQGPTRNRLPSCIYAPTERRWEHLGPITDIPRFLVDRGFRVGVYAPWLDRSLIPWDSRDQAIHLVQSDTFSTDLVPAEFLVTDASPIVFDFALTSRPILIDGPTLTRHMFLDGGAKSPADQLQTFNNLDELNDLLRPEHLSRAATRVAEFRNRFCEADDGNATDRVVEYLLEKVDQPVKTT